MCYCRPGTGTQRGLYHVVDVSVKRPQSGWLFLPLLCSRQCQVVVYVADRHHEIRADVGVP